MNEMIDVDCCLCGWHFSMSENDYGLSSSDVMCPRCDNFFQDFCDEVNDWRQEKEKREKRSWFIFKLTKIILPEDTK